MNGREAPATKKNAHPVRRDAGERVLILGDITATSVRYEVARYGGQGQPSQAAMNVGKLYIAPFHFFTPNSGCLRRDVSARS